MLKSRVVHWFVDSSGKTSIDQFESGLPLDMGEQPDEYHIVLNTPANASLFCETYDECDSPDGWKRLYTGCPAVGLEGLQTFEQAKVCVRRLCFENPHSLQGGLRRATKRDRAIARLNALYRDMVRNTTQRASQLGEGASMQQIATIAEEVRDEVGPDKLIMTLSSHPVWRRLSWIWGMQPAAAFHLLGAICDPTWYIDPGNPLRTAHFKQRCGLYNYSEAVTGEGPGTDVLYMLLQPLTKFIQAKDRPDLDDPKLWFHRYAIRYGQQELNEVDDPRLAYSTVGLRFAERLCDFLWLSWMDAIHKINPRHLDEERFFVNEPEVAHLAYTSACT